VENVRLAPEPGGNARLIAERAELSTPPAAVEITIEPSAGSPTPSGPVVVS
jgi:anti-sigma-K factor RskA